MGGQDFSSCQGLASAYGCPCLSACLAICEVDLVLPLMVNFVLTCMAPSCRKTASPMAPSSAQLPPKLHHCSPHHALCCAVLCMQAFGITTKEALLAELKHQLGATQQAAAAPADVAA